MNPIDVLNELWTQILKVTSLFVIPDWGALIGLLPVFIVIGLIAPFLTFTMLGALIYLARKPRVKLRFVEGPRVAEIGLGGEPIFPVGFPHCRHHALIYPSGTIFCERDQEDLAVICPMCSLGRSARVDTCSNCGLVLKVVNHPVVVRSSAGPKAGGAAAA